MQRAVAMLLGVAGCIAFPVAARATDCPAPSNGSMVDVPGHPFGVAVSSDGCWMFASLTDGKRHGSLAVLHAVGGVFVLERVVELAHAGMGDALTHDGTLLAVAEGADVEMFDVAGLEQAGGKALLGRLRDGRNTEAVYAVSSRGDRLLFVSEEMKARLAVYDLVKWRAHDFRGTPLVGYVPTSLAPVGLALSPNGQWLYSTSEVARADADSARSCKPETRSERMHPQGYLLRIDVAKAAIDPSASVAGGVQAGCNPVRVAVSPNGTYLWVTARDDGSVLRVNADDLVSGNRRATVASFRVGTSPIGVAVRPDGHQVWVALSDRFAAKNGSGKGRQLTGLIGTDNVAATSVQIVSEPVSGFPRELAFLPDGRTLVVGLFTGNRIEFFTTPP